MSAALRVPAFIGLGSNLNNPSERLDAALAALAKLPESRLVAESRRYITTPVGPKDQPPFLNAVLCLLTRLSATDLFDACLAIERDQGRQRGSGERWGPRTLDLDLLVYGEHVLDDEQLRVPHPRLAERAFVLAPLCDIAPLLPVPGVGRVMDLYAALPASERAGAWPQSPATEARRA